MGMSAGVVDSGSMGMMYQGGMGMSSGVIESGNLGMGAMDAGVRGISGATQYTVMVLHSIIMCCSIPVEAAFVIAAAADVICCQSRDIDWAARPVGVERLRPEIEYVDRESEWETPYVKPRGPSYWDSRPYTPGL